MTFNQFSDVDPRYQPSSGFVNSPDPELDADMQWPPKVDSAPIDEGFLQGVLPECLTVSERHTVSTEFYWHGFLRQFPYLIAMALSECMQAEGALAQAKEYQIQSEDADDEKQATSNAKTSLLYARDSAQYLLQARAFLSLALSQFDPKLNPAAYYVSKDGSFIRSTAVVCDFTPESIKAFNTDMQSREYFYGVYKCVQALLGQAACDRAIKYQGLIKMKEWCDQGLIVAQNIIREYKHLDEISNAL